MIEDIVEPIESIDLVIEQVSNALLKRDRLIHDIEGIDETIKASKRDARTGAVIVQGVSIHASVISESLINHCFLLRAELEGLDKKLRKMRDVLLN